jgi:hypothetical protein
LPRLPAFRCQAELASTQDLRINVDGRGDAVMNTNLCLAASNFSIETSTSYRALRSAIGPASIAHAAAIGWEEYQS